MHCMFFYFHAISGLQLLEFLSSFRAFSRTSVYHCARTHAALQIKLYGVSIDVTYAGDSTAPSFGLLWTELKVAVTIRWTGLLDSRKMPLRIKEQNFRTPKSLATLPTALKVVQFIQGQLRYVYRRASAIAIAV